MLFSCGPCPLRRRCVSLGQVLRLCCAVSSGYNTAVPHRILCICATDAILQTRKLLLERHGYDVIPALNFRDVEMACQDGNFHLALVGHDLETKIKKALGLKI